jgi:hypothetical protein
MRSSPLLAFHHGVRFHPDARLIPIRELDASGAGKASCSLIKRSPAE